jgi:hypothetical protein
MTREEKIQAIADYFEWLGTGSAAFMSREQSLAAYDQHLELEELREFRAAVEGGGVPVAES